MNQFDIVPGRFEPDDRAETISAKGIGCYALWQAVWQITEGPFNGEWAMAVVPTPDKAQLQFPFAWVPESWIKVCSLN